MWINIMHISLCFSVFLWCLKLMLNVSWMPSQTTVVTTRRILERIVVHYVSQRMAWKLLKGIFSLKLFLNSAKLIRCPYLLTWSSYYLPLAKLIKILRDGCFIFWALLEILQIVGFLGFLEQISLDQQLARLEGACLLWFTSTVWAEQHSEVKAIHELFVHYEIPWGFDFINYLMLTFFLLCIGHMLGVAASWLVQVGIDLYRFFSSTFQGQYEDNDVDQTNQVGVLGQKVVIATVRCTSSLIFASIGAGIGATFIRRPWLGQWVGKIVNNTFRELQDCCILLEFCDFKVLCE